MKTQHTPGPWLLVEECGERKIVAPPKDQRLSTRQTLMCDMNYYPWCPEEVADWRLIAAAPDLLEALKELAALDFGALVTTDDDERRIDLVARRARAAIAKATGE
jgi:hypothetical protein